MVNTKHGIYNFTDNISSFIFCGNNAGTYHKKGYNSKTTEVFL